MRYNHMSEPYCKKKAPLAKGNICFCDACAVGKLPNKKYNKQNYLQKKKLKKSYVSNEAGTVKPLPEPPPGDANPAAALAYSMLGTATSTQFGSSMQCDTKTSPVRSVRNYKYGYVVVCKESSVAIPFLGINKNDFDNKLLTWLAEYYNRYGRYPRDLHFDQGGEFTSKKLFADLAKLGINVTFSATQEHNQNAFAERKIGTAWMAMLAILAHAGVPFQFWCYAFMYAVLVANNCPHRGHDWKTPCEVAGLPSFDHWIHVFGCLVYYTDPSRMAHDAKARQGVFLGLSDDIKGYLILDILSRKVIVSRNMLANEYRYPFIQVMKPCLIMLKFGTWPKIDSDLEARSDSAVQVEMEIVRNGGNVDDVPANVPVNASKVKKNANSTSDAKVLEYESKSEKPTGGPNPVNYPTLKDLSPIFNQDQDSRWEDFGSMFKTPDRGDTNSNVGTSINLETPVLGKKATKRFSQFNDQYYYNSNDPERLATYESRLRKDVKGSVEREPKSDRLSKFKDSANVDSKLKRNLTTIPEKEKLPTLIPNGTPDGKIDGEDGWEILKILSSSIVEGKRFYRVRWKGKWKDQNLAEDNVQNCEDVLREYWSRKKKKNVPENMQRLLEGKMSERAYLSDVKTEIPVEQEKSAYHEIVETVARKNAMLLSLLEKSKYRKGVSPEPEMINLLDSEFEHSTGSEKLQAQFQRMFKAQLEDQDFEVKFDHSNDKDYCDGETKDPSNEDSESAFKTTSSEFDRPPDYSEHIDVPEDVNPNDCIAYALHSVLELVDNHPDLITKPNNYDEMMVHVNRDEFIEAMERELYELKDNKTFEFCICPKNRRPIPCRWVFDIKRGINNEIVRFKARLVIQGFRQVEGVDFHKTFSSVAQMRTFRVICALSVNKNLRVTQYDISNAFLNADLDKEIYMKLPPGYTTEGDKNRCWKLLKGLYGLKQASRLWNKLLIKSFKQANLEPCLTESGVLRVVGGSKSICFVNLHVDDYCIATADEVLRTEIEGVMAKLFKVSYLGELKLYLGIVCEWGKSKTGRRTLNLHQGPYHDRLLTKMNYSKCKPHKAPAEAGSKLSVTDGPRDGEDPVTWPYMSVGGSFMYSAMGTRPDLCQRTIQCARFNRNPGLPHVNAQKHLLRYLKHTKSMGILFTEPDNPEGKVDITAFCDSDWAGCPDTRRSTIGFVVMLSGGPVTWKSTLKKTLALSSCEAEFMALTEVAREVIWLCRFLDELGIEYNTPRIYCDSASAICWAEEPVQHQRNKHVELRYYYIRDVIGKKLVKVFKINTLFNASDPLTKPATLKMTDTLVPVLLGHAKPTLEE